MFKKEHTCKICNDIDVKKAIYEALWLTYGG